MDWTQLFQLRQRQNTMDHFPERDYERLFHGCLLYTSPSPRDRQKSPNFMIDVLADEQILSDLTWTAEESHALMVGGGISKHHVIWWNQYRGGLDSAVSITTAPEYDGSLSGARLREAISWGKIRPEASQVVVEGDASVLLPLLGGDLFSS